MKPTRPPVTTPEQRDYTRALGAFLGGRISEDMLQAAHTRAYPGRVIAQNKLALMRRIRLKTSRAPPV